MIRSTTILGAAVVLTFAAACDNAGVANQQRATEAQTEANDKIAAAKAEAEEKIAAAQSEADETIANVQADFAKTVEDYRHSTQANLDELDKQIDLLDAKWQTLKGKAKTDLQTSVGKIRMRRDAFVANRKALQTTTRTTWDGTKVRLDKEWNELKGLVDQTS